MFIDMSFPPNRKPRRGDMSYTEHQEMSLLRSFTCLLLRIYKHDTPNGVKKPAVPGYYNYDPKCYPIILSTFISLRSYNAG